MLKRFSTPAARNRYVGYRLNRALATVVANREVGVVAKNFQVSKLECVSVAAPGGVDWQVRMEGYITGVHPVLRLVPGVPTVKFCVLSPGLKKTLVVRWSPEYAPDDITTPQEYWDSTHHAQDGLLLSKNPLPGKFGLVAASEVAFLYPQKRPRPVVSLSGDGTVGQFVSELLVCAPDRVLGVTGFLLLNLFKQWESTHPTDSDRIIVGLVDELSEAGVPLWDVLTGLSPEQQVWLFGQSRKAAEMAGFRWGVDPRLFQHACDHIFGSVRDGSGTVPEVTEILALVR